MVAGDLIGRSAYHLANGRRNPQSADGRAHGKGSKRPVSGRIGWRCRVCKTPSGLPDSRGLALLPRLFLDFLLLTLASEPEIRNAVQVGEPKAVNYPGSYRHSDFLETVGPTCCFIRQDNPESEGWISGVIEIGLAADPHYIRSQLPRDLVS